MDFRGYVVAMKTPAASADSGPIVVDGPCDLGAGVSTRDDAEMLRTQRELIARLAPEQGIVQDEQGGCVWCGAGDSWIRLPEHMPDCPWLEARAIVGGEEFS